VFLGKRSHIFGALLLVLHVVSFDPFIRNLNLALDRQVALTYLSTHLKKE